MKITRTFDEYEMDNYDAIHDFIKKLEQECKKQAISYSTKKINGKVHVEVILKDD